MPERMPNVTSPPLARHPRGLEQRLPSALALRRAAALIVLAGLAAAASAVELGPQVVVNEEVACSQFADSRTTTADGGFFVTWTSEVQGNSHLSVHGRFFGPDGSPRGGEVELSTPRLASQSSSSVTRLADGDLLAVWVSKGVFAQPAPADGFLGIVARRYAPDGTPRGLESLAAPRSGVMSTPLALPLGDGGWALLWSETHYPDATTAKLRTFDADGTPRGPAITVSPRELVFTQDFQTQWHAAALADGGLVVVWLNWRPDDTGYSLYARRFDSEGRPFGGEVEVDDRAGGAPPVFGPGWPRVAATPDGGWLAAWHAADGEVSVWARPISAAGDPGPVVQLLEPGFGAPFDLAVGPRGEVALGWYTSDDGPVYRTTNWARLFTPSLAPVGDALQLSAPADLPADPLLQFQPNGDLLAVWTSTYVLHGPPFDTCPHLPYGDGSGAGVLARVVWRACDGPGDLCLAGRRFRATARWTTRDGATGTGAPRALSRESGSFWFFSPDNVELFVKLLDGRPLNGRFWVFAAALSDVVWDLEIEDQWTGERHSYHNAAGTLASWADTAAFPLDGTAAPSPIPPPPWVGEDVAPPLPDPGTDLLLGERFRVRAIWTLGVSGPRQAAPAWPLSERSGGFWFFSPTNLELLVKVLDGRAVNGRFWVFYAGLTDVDVEIEVTDTATGAVRRYRKPAGQMASVADIHAF
jgi:hypothetical protein